jgi:hypothetical protein
MTNICYYPRRAIRDAGLSLSARRFLLALCTRYNPQEVFTLSLPDIKQQTPISPVTFRLARAALLDADYLTLASHADCKYPCYRFRQEQMLELNRNVCIRLLASGLPNAATAVFLYLYDCQGAGQPELSIAEISEHSGVSRSNLCIMLKNLSEAGLLQIERRQDSSGQHFSNRYSIPGTAAANYII